MKISQIVAARFRTAQAIQTADNISFALSCALPHTPPSPYTPGLLLFCAGFAVEAVSDLQKFVFKMDPTNEGKFIKTGLWSVSRHPNYFGEMVLWWGIYVTSVPALTGAQHAAVLSPIALTFLLCFVSGIPILERSADKRWGGDETYEDYKAKTPVLVPWIHTGFLEPTYDA